jgi:ribosomal protein L24E
MFVRKDGSILWFINNKAQKSFLQLGRDARKLKWTKAYQKGGLSSHERKVVKDAEKASQQAERASEQANRASEQAETAARAKKADAQ